MMNNEYEITNQISPDEYLDMRRSVGWSTFPIEEAKEGLKHTSFLCCIRDKGKAVGIGRAIWDHGYVVFIADIIVRPEYQKRGLGRIIMNDLLVRIKQTLKPGYRIMVSLLAAKGKEKFYEKFGFIDRPNDTFGSGMHQWIEGE